MCKLLKEMPADLRREILVSQFSTAQRAALEQYMLSNHLRGSNAKKQRAKKSYACRLSKAVKTIDICDNAKCIRQVASGGFYAELQFQSLRLSTRVSKEHQHAHSDHCILTEIAECVRRDKSAESFSAKVRSVMSTVLSEFDLDANSFIRSYCIEVPSHHWLGCKLKLYRSNLDDALDAWERVNAAKGGIHLFNGGQASNAYTAEKAQQQWKQLKDTFVALCVEEGRKSYEEVVASLEVLESRRTLHVTKAAAQWQQQKETLGSKLRSQFDDAVYAWECSKSVSARKAQKSSKTAAIMHPVVQSKMGSKRSWHSLGECAMVVRVAKSSTAVLS